MDMLRAQEVLIRTLRPCAYNSGTAPVRIVRRHRRGYDGLRRAETPTGGGGVGGGGGIPFSAEVVTGPETDSAEGIPGCRYPLHRDYGVYVVRRNTRGTQCTARIPSLSHVPFSRRDTVVI